MWPFGKLRTSTFHKTRKAHRSLPGAIPVALRARYDAAQTTAAIAKLDIDTETVLVQ